MAIALEFGEQERSVLASLSNQSAVIFDVDGVLVMTDEMHFRAWSEIAEAERIPFDRATNDRMRGISRTASLDILLERATTTYSEIQKHQLADRKNELFRSAIESLSPQDVVAGALPLIAALRQRGILVGAASSSRNARTILERLDVAPLLDAIVDGNDLTRSKPDPQAFLAAAQALRIEPGMCVVIEDAAAGVEAAHRAGMRAIGIGDPHLLGQADDVYRTISEIRIDSLIRT
jgi:beta-phosphoglucomutase